MRYQISLLITSSYHLLCCNLSVELRALHRQASALLLSCTHRSFEVRVLLCHQGRMWLCYLLTPASSVCSPQAWTNTPSSPTIHKQMQLIKIISSTELRKWFSLWSAHPCGAEEMVQQFRALNYFTEDSLDPSTHTGRLTNAFNFSSKVPTPQFWLLWLWMSTGTHPHW